MIAITEKEQEILTTASQILARSLRTQTVIDDPDIAKKFCQYYIGAQSREHFAVLLLDAGHALIEPVTLSIGTVAQAAVYPREVVKAALHYNASAVILTHNHPSGRVHPSNADRQITQRIREALRLIDIEVLDHLIVAGATPPYSFKEHVLL